MRQITGADHRHHPGAALGLRAGRLHSRHLRPALPPIRRHHQRRHADLGGQRADAVAGALRRVPAPRAARSAASWRMVLRGIDDVRDGYASIVRRLVRVAVLSLVARRGLRRRHLRRCRASRRRASCPRRIRAPSSSTSSCRTAPRSRAPARPSRQVEAHAERHAAGRRTSSRSSASRCSTAAASRTPASCVAKLKPFDDRTAPPRIRRRR